MLSKIFLKISPSNYRNGGGKESGLFLEILAEDAGDYARACKILRVRKHPSRKDLSGHFGGKLIFFCFASSRYSTR